MWICGNCGRPVRDDRAEACPPCSSVKGTRRLSTVRPSGGAAEQPAAANAAATAVKPPQPAPAPVKPQAPAAPPPPPEPRVKLGERPLVTMAKRLARQPRFWIVLTCVLAVVVAVPWAGMQLAAWVSRPAPKTDPLAVEEETKKHFEKMVDQALSDKLEWGREVLRNRLPSRFPEELVMEVDKQKADRKYDSRKKNPASFNVQISYHFEDDHPKAIRWYPVVFFFQKQEDTWYLIGDNWLKESELIFE